VHLGVFGLLENQPLTEQELGERLCLSPRGTDSLVVGLVALGLLRRGGERVHLEEEASHSLVPGKKGYLGGLIELEMGHFMTPDRLLTAMRSGRPGVYGGDDSEDAWGVHAADPDKARAFTLGMHSISEIPAEALAESLDLSDCRRMLDIGGGSGVFVIAALRRWPHLRGTVADLAAVCPIAQELFDEAGLGERADTAKLDMFREEFPVGFDLILFSQIMHDWSLDTNLELVTKAWRALPGGGRVVLHEKLLNPERTGPLANALVCLDMLYWTEGKQYTAQELLALLERAGFRDARVTPTIDYWSMVVAEKA
jgi:SAM-dependent methyltransferase